MDDETLRWARDEFHRPMLPLAKVEGGFVYCMNSGCKRMVGGDDGKPKNVWWYCRDCKHGIYIPNSVD